MMAKYKCDKCDPLEKPCILDSGIDQPDIFPDKCPFAIVGGIYPDWKEIKGDE